MARRRYYGRRRRGGRRGFRAGKWVGLAFRVIGGVVAASPVISRAQANLPGGNFKGFADGVAYDYSAGMTSGTFDASAAGRTYGALLAGLIVAKVGGYLAKRM